MTLFEDRDRTPRPARPHATWRTRGIVAGLVLAVGAAGGLALTALPSNPFSGLTSYTLSSEIAQIADRIGFSDSGREIFLASRPQLLDSVEFRRACDDTPDGTEDGEFAAVGCFYGLGAGFGRIAIFRPGDIRLADQMVVTAAHEFLHAAYARMTAGERARLDGLLDARWSLIPADDPIQASLASSVGSTPENRSTEEFAYLGTEIADAVDPALEDYYAALFRDRGAVVAVHAADEAFWHGLETDYASKSGALSDENQANADAAAQLRADRAQLDADRTGYNRQVADYNALSPPARARMYVMDADGTVSDVPYGRYLDERRSDFTTREADQAGRQAQNDAAEAAAVLARSDVDRLYTDLEALTAAAVPSAR